MAGQGKQNNTKAKQIVKKKDTNQLELTESKKQTKALEEDNGSININQIEPKKIKLN